jgi:hypothetical protein
MWLCRQATAPKVARLCISAIDLYTIDSAIHRVVCQKYDVLDNSDIQDSQKLDPLEKTVKKFNSKIS